MDRYLIVTYKNAAKVTAITRSFSQSEVDSGKMRQYIEQKTRAGIECHQFDYSTSFAVESRVVPTQNA